jgi:uncharacterized protein YndB with AHSA1/START domain
MALSTSVENRDTTDREIVISRLISSPRELVFMAWSDPKHLSNWWGPNGFTVTTEKMEFKEGGSWKYVMHGPDGQDYDNLVTYRQIKRPERLVYDHGGDDGKVAFKVTATFEAVGDKTKVTMHSVFPTAEARNLVVERYGAIEGGKQTIGRLDDYVRDLSHASGTKPFVISRIFKAPIDLMFEVWTQPKHLQHWFGPKGGQIKHSKMDFRPGGTYHYCMDYSGTEMWGKFTYREIVKPERIAYINSFSNAQGGLGRHPFSPNWPAEMLTTITFTAHLDHTTVKIEWVPINATEAELKTFEEGRGSMTQGWSGTFERLEEYLKTGV